MCFQKDGKTAQAARCIKSRIMTKVIDSVLSIDTFEQQFFVLKSMLKSPKTKILDVKKKTDACRVGAAKSKRKAIKYGNTSWALKQKRKGN